LADINSYGREDLNIEDKGVSALQSYANNATAGKDAVVLSGGGGFGAFEVGVLKTLVSGRSPATAGAHLQVETFTGTSVGAYNAAVLASRPDLNIEAAVVHLEDIWLDRIAGDLADNGILRIRGNPLWLFDINKLISNSGLHITNATRDAVHFSRNAVTLLANFLGSPLPLFDRTIEMFDLASFISTEPMLALVNETVSLHELNRSRRTLKIATTNWVSGELRIFVHDPCGLARKGNGSQKPRFSREENLTDKMWPSSLLASAAIPGVFPPVMIDGVPHVDGGVGMNTPLRPAVDAGATTVHLICPNPDTTDMPMNNGLHVFERLLHLVVTATLNDDVEKIRRVNSLIQNSPQLSENEHYRPMTVHRYSPRMDSIGIAGMLDFRADRLRRRIALGEQAAMHHDCKRERCVLPQT